MEALTVRTMKDTYTELDSLGKGQNSNQPVYAGRPLNLRHVLSNDSDKLVVASFGKDQVLSGREPVSPRSHGPFITEWKEPLRGVLDQIPSTVLS